MFPTEGYDYYRDGIVQNVVGIYKSIRPLQNFIDNLSGYNYYEIKNGERPDIVSQRLYGTVNYYWVFFIINILNVRNLKMIKFCILSHKFSILRWN